MAGNPFLSGCGIGLLAPLAAWLLAQTSWGTAIGGNSLGLYVIAALINLVLARFFYRKDLEGSARGVILVTFASLLLLLFRSNLV